MMQSPGISTIESTLKKRMNMHITILGITVLSLLIALIINRMFFLRGIIHIGLGTVLVISIEWGYLWLKKQPVSFKQYELWVQPINTALLIALLTPVRATYTVLILAVVFTYLSKYIMQWLFQRQIINPIVLGLIGSQLLLGQRLNISETFLSLFEGQLSDFSYWQLLFGLYEGFSISSTVFIFLAFAAGYLIISKAIDSMIFTHTMVHLIVWTVLIALLTSLSFPVVFNMIWLGPAAFTLVFLIPDMPSTPEIKESRIIYAFLVVWVYVFFRIQFGLIPAAFFSLAISQLVMWITERFFTRTHKRYQKMIVAIMIVLYALIILRLLVA